MRMLAAVLLLVSCTGAERGGRMGYPDHWWAPVPEAARHSWEILPQAASREKGEVILSKRNELGLLSNFSPTPFTFRGKKYASLEGFWQSMKYPEGQDDPRNGKGITWEHTRDEVAAMTAFAAHSAGVKAEANMAKLGIDWVSFDGERIRYKSDPAGIDRHYQLIFEATKAKVEQNPKVKEVLLSTGTLDLKPDHFEDKDGTKAWKYYEIHMLIRNELRRGAGRK